MRPIARRALIFLFAVLAGIAGGAAGWLITGLVADFVLGLGGMSGREGGRAMYAFWAIGPIGAGAGLLIGSWLVLHFYGGYRSFGKIAGGTTIVLASIFALAAGVLGVLYLSDDVLVRNGPVPRAEFEIRLPERTSLPAALEGLTIELNTAKNSQAADGVRHARHDDERPVIIGAVDLYFRTSGRILVLRMQGEPDRLFELKLRADPPHETEFGPWQRVDYVADLPEQNPRKANDTDRYHVRYRVERTD